MPASGHEFFITSCDQRASRFRKASRSLLPSAVSSRAEAMMASADAHDRLARLDKGLEKSKLKLFLPE